ncbi:MULTISPECIES: GNAT family N-acetyltransferase [unclassified Pseudomonas]|jgi:ribosomal protein S18 acetylase RimI-like enzyme|uniref:GNAT family N-acetyltransferase n=1 Tax=unclassified Pseudomonas TaxID=196821 RepID=UPI000DAE454E|nr:MULTISPECIES: GNAT family N-acetyltransferase [unclassified Pseudomonas]MBD9655262.1 GNAT family N-acetyltransferase [Pseudomonas sp. PDM12]PZW47865.1 acetyltransferase (GNAT) family protein [Pseudomonas sp. URMO17WK12:I2]
MTATIRLATCADIETLFDIRTSVIENHLSREQLDELGITAAALQQAIEESACAWVAELQGTAAGFAMIDAEAGELFALFVRPQCEGRGLGAMLLEAAEQALFANHEVIYLVTDGHEAVRANGFYRRHGWAQVAKVDERDVRYEKRRVG